MQSRNKAIDITKGVGIILVVIGHSHFAKEHRALADVLFSFHMPLFFYLAGLFFKSDDVGRFIVMRADAIYKPYLVVMLVLLALRCAHLYHADVTVSGIAQATAYSLPWVPLWFLPHLFIASVVAFLMILLVGFDEPLAVAGVAMTLLVLGGTQQEAPHLPWTVGILPLSVSFILLGYATRDFAKKMLFKPMYLAFSLLVFGFLNLYFKQTMNLSYGRYDSFWVCSAQAFLGIYICLSVSAWLGRFKRISSVLSYVGAGSLFVLLFHSILLAKVDAFSQKITSNEYIVFAVSVIGAVLLPLLILELAKRVSVLRMLLLPIERRRAQVVIGQRLAG